MTSRVVDASLPTRGHVIVLAVLFFVSGAAALTYQVLWVRELGLLFGSTAEAAALTIAIFFGGVSAGRSGAAVWHCAFRSPDGCLPWLAGAVASPLATAPDLAQTVQQLVQTGHVNALDVRSGQIDLDVGASMQFTAIPRFCYEHRQIDTLHAHPLQRAQDGCDVGKRDIGKRCSHFGDPLLWGLLALGMPSARKAGPVRRPVIAGL